MQSIESDCNQVTNLVLNSWRAHREVLQYSSPDLARVEHGDIEPFNRHIHLFVYTVQRLGSIGSSAARGLSQYTSYSTQSEITNCTDVVDSEAVSSDAKQSLACWCHISPDHSPEAGPVHSSCTGFLEELLLRQPSTVSTTE